MKITLFSVFSYVPLWRKQPIEQEYLDIKLIFSIFSYSISFWSITAIINAFFSVGLLKALQKDFEVLTLLTKIIPNLVLGSLFSILGVLFATIYISKLELNTLRSRFIEFKYDIIESLRLLNDSSERTIKVKFYIVILFILSMGFIAGILDSIVWFIPIFLLFVFLFFVLANFVNVNSILFLISITISWLIFYYFRLNSKLKGPEKEVPVVSKYYPKSLRLRSIDKSSEAPIVCPSCKSFIPAKTEFCPVCDDVILEK